MGYIAGPRALLYPNGPREALPNCNLPIDRPTSVRSPDTRGCRQLATVGQTERLETVELQRVAAVTRHPLRSIDQFDSVAQGIIDVDSPMAVQWRIRLRPCYAAAPRGPLLPDGDGTKFEAQQPSCCAFCLAT